MKKFMVMLLSACLFTFTAITANAACCSNCQTNNCVKQESVQGNIIDAVKGEKAQCDCCKEGCTCGDCSACKAKCDCCKEGCTCGDCPACKAKCDCCKEGKTCTCTDKKCSCNKTKANKKCKCKKGCKVTK